MQSCFLQGIVWRQLWVLATTCNYFFDELFWRNLFSLCQFLRTVWDKCVNGKDTVESIPPQWVYLLPPSVNIESHCSVKAKSRQEIGILMPVSSTWHAIQTKASCWWTLGSNHTMLTKLRPLQVVRQQSLVKTRHTISSLWFGKCIVEICFIFTS